MAIRDLLSPVEGQEIRRVGYVFGLPLLDGVFVTLVLAGVLESITGILLVGAVVFCGSGTLAIILAELADAPRENLTGLLAVGIVVVPVAALEASLAPTVASVLDVELLTWVGATVLLILGGRIGSQWLARRLPRPRPVVLIGLLLSVRPGGLAVPAAVDLQLAVAGAGAALAGIGFAVLVLVLGGRIRRALDGERFRFGGGLALCVLGVSLLTPIPAYGSLLVLVIAIVLSIEETSVEELRLETPTSGEEPVIDSESP